MMEVCASVEQRDRLLACVDELGILFTRRRRGAHPENTIFAVQEDLAIARQVIGDQRRQADPQIDVGALGYVACDARGKLVAVVAFHARCLLGHVPVRRVSAAPTATTFLTNMPGVTIASGSSSPRATTSRTCAMAHLAAVA